MYPYTIEPIEKEVNVELMNYFKGERRGFCRVGPEKWILPMRYMDQAEGYYNMPVRKDDVWIITYPRSGILNNSILLMKSINFVLLLLLLKTK